MPDRTFSAGLVLFLRFDRRKPQAPAVVQDELLALSAVSAACPGMLGCVCP